MHPSLHINYKNFDLKQSFKEGRGCRTEGTFRNPNDFGIDKGLANLPYLQKIGRQINRRLLEVERVSHNSGLSGDSIQRVVQPAVTGNHSKLKIWPERKRAVNLEDPGEVRHRTVEEAILAFEAHCVSEGLKDSTRRKYRNSLAHL